MAGDGVVGGRDSRRLGQGGARLAGSDDGDIFGDRGGGGGHSRGSRSIGSGGGVGGGGYVIWDSGEVSGRGSSGLDGIPLSLSRGGSGGGRGFGNKRASSAGDGLVDSGGVRGIGRREIVLGGDGNGGGSLCVGGVRDRFDGRGGGDGGGGGGRIGG